jgi:hypothetical protein
MYSTPKLKKVEKIILNKHDIDILNRASEILSAINEDYECSKAVDENCSFNMYMLCSSLEELLEMIEKEEE